MDEQEARDYLRSTEKTKWGEERAAGANVYHTLEDLYYLEGDGDVALSAERFSDLDSFIEELMFENMGLRAALERRKRVRPNDHNAAPLQPLYVWDRIMDAMSDRDGQIHNVRVGRVEFRVMEKHAEPELGSIGIHFDGKRVAWISLQQIREAINAEDG